MSLQAIGRRSALGLALGLGLLVGAPWAGPPADPAATVDAFHAALVRGDGDAAAVLLTEDAMIFEEGYVERSKAEYVEGHLRADMTFSAAVPATVTTRKTTQAGVLAVVMTESTMKGAYSGKTIDRTSVETMTLRREKAGWRIFHIHWSGRANP